MTGARHSQTVPRAHMPILERVTGSDDYQLECVCDVDLFDPFLEAGEMFMRHIEAALPAPQVAATPRISPLGTAHLSPGVSAREEQKT